jgi:uncharacterized 2Fe-2S/4Fe-4S cluster protein (DUF4445 family)
MADHLVTFDNTKPVSVPTGTLLSEAARLAGVEIGQPCGGQGRCGRCAVQVTAGQVRRRSSLRLSAQDIEQGYALACQAVVESDITVTVPPQEKIERRLTTDRVAIEIPVPADYDAAYCQTIQRIPLTLTPPRLDDHTDDWSRLQTALRQQAGTEQVQASLKVLQKIGTILRTSDTAPTTVEAGQAAGGEAGQATSGEAGQAAGGEAGQALSAETAEPSPVDAWRVTAVLDAHVEVHVEVDGTRTQERLIDLLPGHVPKHDPLWGAAIDIGTTTVTLWLVDLTTGKVLAQVAEYNGQIARGEDVISRIIYASKESGRQEMQARVIETINQLIDLACKRANTSPNQIVKATIAGNSTMSHLLLGIPATSIRLAPFITAINHPPLLTATDLGLHLHPEATVDCLPGVASYVGADISAGVLACRMDETEKLTLFLDVGTNGETVLGSREWLVTCACSAGPAFEGAGVRHGMRATKGAIEEVWINNANAAQPYEPTYRVIGSTKPRGLCGSGLISLLSELFLTGAVDKAGNVNLALAPVTPRIREGEHGPEFVVAWGPETEDGKDIVISNVDIDNLKRAKGRHLRWISDARAERRRELGGRGADLDWRLVRSIHQR